ncbi:Uncharacterised protein [uncultured archaeon]|nr:Uncharacterised protein [uncultured archaeon]
MAVEQMLEEPAPVQEITPEELKALSITNGIVERSYLQSIKTNEDELGESRLGELSVAISIDPNNVPVLTIASKSDYLIEQFQDAIQKAHVERPAVLELPEEDRDRIARIEGVNVLSYLQKREKARAEEFERLKNYEPELGDQYQ